MKRPAVPALLLLALGAAEGLAGCGNTEIPSVEIGSGGARLMTGGARTPLEAYENAYSQIHRQHYNVRLNLKGASENLYAAKESMDLLARSLETMREMAAPARRAEFDPYVTRYREWTKDLEHNRWGGSFFSDLDRSENEIKGRFNPANVDILVDFPGAPPSQAPPAATAPPAKAPDPGLADKAELPKSDAPAAGPATPPAAAPPSATPPTPGAPARLLFKAWSRAHDDLIEAYKGKKDCRRLYEDVLESLRLMKAQTPAGPAANKLQIYLEYYAAVHDKTKGFTALPPGEKITEKDVIDELELPARVIRKEFNPDR